MFNSHKSLEFNNNF